MSGCLCQITGVLCVQRDLTGARNLICSTWCSEVNILSILLQAYSYFEVQDKTFIFSGQPFPHLHFIMWSRFLFHPSKTSSDFLITCYCAEDMCLLMASAQQKSRVQHGADAFSVSESLFITSIGMKETWISSSEDCFVSCWVKRCKVQFCIPDSLLRFGDTGTTSLIWSICLLHSTFSHTE